MLLLFLIIISFTGLQQILAKLHLCGSLCRVIGTTQPANDAYIPRHCQRRKNTNCALIIHKSYLSIQLQHHGCVEDAIRESGAEHLTTTNTAGGVEDIVVESDDADSIEYDSDSSTPQTIMDPLRDMLEIVQQMVGDDKAERDHQRLKGKDYNGE